MSIFNINPGGSLSGTIKVPGDKSISHRSIMLGALAEGKTTVTGFLEGEDSVNTLRAFRAMGVNIEGPNNGEVVIHGVGLHGLKPPTEPLYLGNSGTSMRLLSGLLAGQAFDSELTGDESLAKRPMRRVTEPLALMGAKVDTAENGCPPLKITGKQTLKGFEYVMPMASAQVKSCLLLAGLYAQGKTAVTEPALTRDHTERMLKGFAYPVERQNATVSIQSGHHLKATHIEVPADISSAAFFMVGASIALDSKVTLTGVGINATRTGVLDILRLMGANIRLQNEREVGGEDIADIVIKSAPLHGIQIPEELVPLAIDEFPAIFIAAACAEGTTVLSGAEELRVKESDRIQVMADGLQALGIAVEPTTDGIVIQGNPEQAVFAGGEVHSHGDHRIAMSFAMAGLRAGADIRILDCDNVNTSFPGFVDLANQAGLNIQIS